MLVVVTTELTAARLGVMCHFHSLWPRGAVVSRRSPIKGRTPMQAVADAVPEVLELSRRLVQAQEEERKRISRELHDEAGQGLMVLRLYLGILVRESPNAEMRMTGLGSPARELRAAEALGFWECGKESRHSAAPCAFARAKEPEPESQ